MAAQSVQPLRIQKGTANSSPTKMNRPLAELSPMGIRRNSPSFPHSNKNNTLKGDSSPHDLSPFANNSASSPRLFWQGRDPTSPNRASIENRSPYEPEQSPAPPKRSSIENLKKASRVKNSSMFAREQKNEYDPAQVTVPDRPLATGRPLNMQAQGNAFGGQGLEGMRIENVRRQAEEHINQAMIEPTERISPTMGVAPLSPSKYSVSPAKSSLSKKTGMSARNMGFDPDNGIWSDEEDSVIERKLPEGRSLHRHAKSVTFDQAPPQVNEYEMTTPDPSSVASGSREGSYESIEDDMEEEEEEVSFERGSSLDREDSFDASLEDTDKTPVVLPEDWRFMSPDTVNTDLVREEDDTFDRDYGSPEPTAQPGQMDRRPHQTSINSVDSNGQPRPLPPLPSSFTAGPGSPLSGTLERISSGQRSLPSPPQAAGISKSDIRRMSGSGLSLEDRLKLMVLQDQDREKANVEYQRERKMRRADMKENSPVRDNDPRVAESESSSQDQQSTRLLVEETHISRESILRRLSSQQDLQQDKFEESAMSFSSNLPNYLNTDPDIPIPSREDPTQIIVEEVVEEEVIIKEEPSEESDLYSVPDLYSSRARADSDTEDTESQYSQASAPGLPSPSLDDGQETPRAQSPAREPEKKKMPELERMSLPLLADFGTGNSFDFGLESYMTPSPPVEKTAKKPEQAPQAMRVQDTHRPITPEEQLQPPSMSYFGNEIAEEPGTPDSVIRHPISQSPSPEVAEPIATVKAPGSRLKTRPSITPADASTMAATRRQVSGQAAPPQAQEPSNSEESRTEADAAPQDITLQGSSKRVSSLVQLNIPGDHSDEGLGFGLEREFDRVVEAQKVAFELSLSRLHHPFHGRFPSSETTLGANVPRPKNVPSLKPQGARVLPKDQRAWGHHYPMDGSHFANRSPGRQRGYLMRQNTKVVVASNRADAEGKPAQTIEATPAEPTPRKISQQTWVTEPWNGKSRRRSIRTAGETSPRKKCPSAPVPPLPGQASNVHDGLGAVHEDEVAEEEGQDFDENAERGRLFVKVVGVKDLDLPLARDERSFFALTLDNGLHCVTTSWLQLGRNAPIGQEFELVVLNELEFQLTLQMKLEQPKPQPVESPVKTPPSPVKKQGTFSRLFGSPKKNKEAQVSRPTSPVKPQPPSAYELVQGIVAQDGSFGRAYVALSEHEKHAFGRPYTVDITCFNEWAMEDVPVGSSRSKKSVVVAKQRRPPYVIGKLELLLLYIPKPKGAKDEDMPKSMNSAVRELRDAETKTSHVFEGHLSQQGGDCPYWRRRLFKLAGSKLTAYHETTHQPRATINLAKASKLIDDKSALTKKETSTKGGGRRKSAFAEEEEGYMFVEEGFRIRFANGEVIDFYADSAAEKGDWMKVLSEVVGKPGSSSQPKPWVDVILKRQRSLAAKEGRTMTRPARPEIDLPKCSKEQLQEQMTLRTAAKQRAAAAAAAEQEEARKAAAVAEQRPVGKRSSIPLLASTNQSPEKAAAAAPRFSHGTGPRPGHARTESYQPGVFAGSRSQPGSPVKAKLSKSEARHQKARSMIGMQWH